MLRFSSEMEHGNVRDGNGDAKCDGSARKADGGRKSGKRRNEKRQGLNISVEEDARKREKERNKKIPAPGGSGDGK